MASVDIRKLIEEAARRQGVDPNIALSVARAESSFNPNAVSPAGAIGVMQLMPATAKALGVDPYDTAQNIEGGVRYLKQQYDRFGSWPLALAAYNAGPTAVEESGGIPPYKETQEYVKRVLGALRQTPATQPQTTATQAPAVKPTYKPTSDPLDAARQFLSFIATNRQPSLWSRVPAGTMSEAARHSRALEDISRATLAETIRSNRAGEALSAAEAQQNLLQSLLPQTASERAAAAETAALDSLRQMYDEAYKRAYKPQEKGVRLAPDTRDAVLLAADAIRRYLSDPDLYYDLTSKGGDLYTVLNNFSINTLQRPLVSLRELLKQYSPSGENDPLVSVLNSVIPNTQQILLEALFANQ